MKKSISLALLLALALSANQEARLDGVEVSELGRNDELRYGTNELVKSSTRLDLSLKDTPQSVLVLTAARLKDLGINDYQVLLAHIPGVSIKKWDERVWPSMRGFGIDYYLLDSMPSFSGFSLGTNDINMLPYDRVEIIRGANGLLAGAGNPAASLNFIRKRAEAKELRANLSLNAGSYDKYGFKADVGSKLNSDGSVRGRLAVSTQKQGSFMDYHKRQNTAIYAVLDSDIGDSSWLSLGSFYQDLKRKGIRWGGMPAFYVNGERRSFKINEIFSAPWTKWDISTLDFYADFRHYFKNEASLNLSYSFRKAKTDSKLLYWGDNNLLSNGGKVELDESGSPDFLSTAAFKRDENIHNIDAYFKQPYELFGLEQEFVFGAMYNNYQKSKNKISSFNIKGNPLDGKGSAAGNEYISSFKIDFNNLKIIEPNFPYYTQDNAEKTIQKAIYFANKLALLDELKFILGARLSYYDYTISNARANHSFKNELTPYFGVVYDLGQSHSIYASYTSIFKPQSFKDKNGKLLKPVVGKDYEVGIKGEYFGGSLQASLGFFKIIQDRLGVRSNEKVLGSSEQAYEAKKGVTSKGFELDINGDVNENISLSFGLAHFNAKDANGNKFDTESARTTANLFAKYSLANFRAGAGLNYASKIYTGSGDSLITQKAYVLANLMLGYKISKNFDVQLNVDNLFNKRYFEGIGHNKMVYGAPRTFNLSFTYTY